MKRSTALSFVLVAVLGAVLAGCGSTVNLGSNAASANDGLGLSSSAGQSATTGPTASATGPDGSTITATSGPSATSAANTIGGGTQGTGGSQSGQSSSAGGAAASAIPTTGPGWTAKVIKIGVVTQKDSEQVFSTFGVQGVDIGDTQGQAEQVASYINSHGGILGRQIQLVFQDAPLLQSAENPDSTAESICTYFNQDDRVVAVISIASTIDYSTWRSCLAKAQIPLFSSSFNAVDETDALQDKPYLYQTTQVAWDFLAPVFMQRLEAEDYFSGWNPKTGEPGKNPVKVGVLVYDSPDGTRIGNLMTRLLAAAGYTSVVYAYSDASNLTPAVVKFNGTGVTHVIVTDLQLLAFQMKAANQDYSPRYAVESYNALLSNLQGLSPKGQNNGAVGVGWDPTSDVDLAHDPGSHGPGETLCAQLIAKAGSTSAKRLAQTFGFSVCDSMFLIARGATAGLGLTGDAINKGIVSLGSSFSPAETFVSGLSATHFFTAGAVRDVAYINSCSCFQYASKTDYRLPS